MGKQLLVTGAPSSPVDTEQRPALIYFALAKKPPRQANEAPKHYVSSNHINLLICIPAMLQNEGEQSEKTIMF